MILVRQIKAHRGAVRKIKTPAPLRPRRRPSSTKHGCRSTLATDEDSDASTRPQNSPQNPDQSAFGRRLISQRPRPTATGLSLGGDAGVVETGDGELRARTASHPPAASGV